MNSKTILIRATGQSIMAASARACAAAGALSPEPVDTPALQGRIVSPDDPVQAEQDDIAPPKMGQVAAVHGSGFGTRQAILVDGGGTI